MKSNLKSDHKKTVSWTMIGPNTDSNRQEHIYIYIYIYIYIIYIYIYIYIIYIYIYIYIKLGFTGVYIIFLISAQKHRSENF